MSIEDVKSREQQCRDLAKMMRDSLDNLDKSARRAAELDNLKDQVNELQTSLDALKIELKGGALSHTDREEYKKKHKELKAILDQLKSDIEWKEQNAEKDELVGDRKAPGHDYNTADGLMAHGDEVLDASKQSLQRTMANVATTVQIGKDTNVKIQQQTETLTRDLEEIYKIKSSVKRSAAILRRMARRVASDKYMWVCVFLVFAAIIFIIVWKSLHSGTDVSVPDQLKP